MTDLGAKLPYRHMEHQVRVPLPPWDEDAGYEDGCAEIDEGIVELIQACWRHHLGTTMSCEGNLHPDYKGFARNAWITFCSFDDARRFIELATGTTEPPRTWTVQERPSGETGVAFPPASISKLAKKMLSVEPAPDESRTD
jgi:hypothetical protein